MDGLSSKSRARLLIMVIGVTIFGVIFSARLTYLMVMKADYYSENATELQERERSIKAKRGVIYDCNGVILAGNKSVCSISVIHNQIEEPERVAEILSKELNLDKDYVVEKVQKYTAREKIKSNVDKETADRIKEYNLAGVAIDSDYRRFYPYDEVASKVIGFTGQDNQGIVGLEVYYEDYLMGTPGSINTLTDARGVVIDNSKERREEPIDGNNLVTSIDINIQIFAENLAKETMIRKNAKRVCIIVMNPQNGEILALTDWPEYNLNEPFILNTDEVISDDNAYQDALNKMWRCYAVNDTYEPGSTFKIFTATAAFEEGTLKVSDTFYCPGYKMVEDRRIRCSSTVGHGAEDFTKGIMNSCNPVFIEVGERVGVENFYKYYKKLELDRKTGIDLYGEASSIIHKKENVGPVELATMSFGQSFQITPLELMRMAAAVVNGGNLITPHFGKYITDENNNIVSTLTYGTIENAVSKETSDTMKGLLEKVVSEGTGKNAKIDGYAIGGKTATSEKLPRSSKKYIASFLGFAPVDNPRVMALVLIDEPEGIYYGGTIAAPVVKELFENILPYLGIEKEIINNELKN